MAILTFGEIMLRLQPFGYKRFMQAEAYEAVYGGGEANVAVSLAQMGEQVKYLTGLPDNRIADKCVNVLRGFGVDTSAIVRRSGRMGIYFCEKGCAQRASEIIYDRAGSVTAGLTLADVDVNAVLDGVEWFHVTGITPALSDGVAELTLALAKAAKEKGITVSCDINYRKKLWSREKANKVMTELVKYVDVLISNEEDVKDVFGIQAEGSDITGGRLSAEGYGKVAREVMKRFPSVKKTAFTLRESISASVNGWSAVLCEGESVFKSKNYVIDIVDRVGGGDSFGAGLIYALKNGYSNAEAIEFATAASCIKQTVEGDFNIVTVAEVKRLAEGDGSGRIQR